MEIEPEKENITVRELLKRYPDRGYIIWSDEWWLLNCAKLRPLNGWEDRLLDYKVECYRDLNKNEPLCIEIYRDDRKLLKKK